MSEERSNDNQRGRIGGREGEFRWVNIIGVIERKYNIKNFLVN